MSDIIMETRFSRLNRMNILSLRNLCKENKYKKYSHLNKKDLITFIMNQKNVGKLSITSTCVKCKVILIGKFTICSKCRKKDIETKSEINNIIETSYIELNNIMDNWCKNYDENFSGGKMRGDRGEHIENFVRFVVNMFKSEYGVNVRAVKGNDDKKELKIPGTDVKKEHQVDIHIYKSDIFIAVIECKAYLDSCYYIRACDDFKLFKKFGYDVKKYIFTLEDSIKEETKLFTDYESDYICDDIFYMLDGKRISTKPIYDKKNKKIINKEKLTYFIKSLQKLLIDI